MSDSLKFTFKIIRFSFIFIDDPPYVTAAGQNTFTVGSTNREDSFAVQCESKNEAGTLYTTSVLNVYGKLPHAPNVLNVYGMLTRAPNVLNVYGMLTHAPNVLNVFGTLFYTF